MAFSMNESIENLEIENIAVSERPKNPPEKGCFISGLSLYGANFDAHKNIVKIPRKSEEFCVFPPVLDFNIDLDISKS